MSKSRIIGSIILLTVLAVLCIFVYQQYRHAAVTSQMKMPQVPAVPKRALNEVDILLNREVSDKKNPEEFIQGTAGSRKTHTLMVNQSMAQDPALEKSSDRILLKSVPTAQTETAEIQTYSPPAMPTAWVIQLATFANKANAANLLKELRELGYDAYSRSMTFRDKYWTQVFVGPDISHENIQRIQAELEKRYRLHGVIKTYHADKMSQQ
jgi:DedD protein